MKEVETCNVKIQASVPKDKRAETIMVHRFNDKSSIFEKKKKKKNVGCSCSLLCFQTRPHPRVTSVEADEQTLPCNLECSLFY